MRMEMQKKQYGGKLDQWWVEHSLGLISLNWQRPLPDYPSAFHKSSLEVMNYQRCQHVATEIDINYRKLEMHYTVDSRRTNHGFFQKQIMTVQQGGSIWL